MDKILTAPVETTGGSVRGYYEDGDIMVFKGIPYAEAPVGEYRFRPSRPYEHRDGVMDCTEFGSSCWQNSLDKMSALVWTEEFVIRNRDYSEDCLTLNIWTQREGKDMPVVVYFYGGGFVSGGSSCDIYNGTPFARQGVVYVTFNHREHVLGWLSSPELTEEGDGRSGNYALSDMEVALKWVRDNIAAFGGDPAKVTIWGQSSGGSQVNLFSVSERMRPLYKNVISMGFNSFPRENQMKWNTYETACEISNELLDKYGRSPEKLRELPAEEFLKYTKIKGPVIDGYYVDDTFRHKVEAGVNPDVTMMMGMVGRDFVIGPMKACLYEAVPEGREAFVRALAKFYPDTAEELMEAYETAGLEETANGILKDSMIYDLLEFAEVRSRSCRGKTYIYHFPHVMPGPHSAGIGSFHSCEVPYFTDFLSPLRDEYWTEADRALAKKMNKLVVGFIRDGKPDIPDFVPSDGSNIFVITAEEQKNVIIEPEKLKKWKRLFGVKEE